MVPRGKIPFPPLDEIRIVQLRQQPVAERVVRQELQPVEDGVLLVFVHRLVGLVEGLYGLLDDRLHPRPPLVPESSRHAHHRVCGAVAVFEDAGVEQVDAGSAVVVCKVDETDAVHEGTGDLFQQAGHEVGMGVYDDDGVAVPARRLLPQLVRDDVAHERGLAHAGARHVEVVPPEQVVGEVDFAQRSRRGIADERPSLHASRRGQERPGPGALHEWRLVARSRRVPQGGDLADSEDASTSEESGTGRVQGHHGRCGRHLAGVEARSGGVVVVTVGRGDLFEEGCRSVKPFLRGQNHDDLDLRVERDARGFFVNLNGVIDAGAVFLPAMPCPAPKAEGDEDSGAHENGLPGFAVPHPQVALERDQRRRSEDGHRHAVGAVRAGLSGVRRLAGFRNGAPVALVLVCLGPVGTERAEQQSRHDALALIQV